VSLSGRVLDQKGSAVQKAEIFTEPETDVVMTNNRGFFTLKQRLDESGVSQQIPAGVYKIKVRKFGFEDAAFEVTIEGGPTKVPDITLAPRTPDINETGAGSDPGERVRQRHDLDAGPGQLSTASNELR
jgi:hypothetical protein